MCWDHAWLFFRNQSFWILTPYWNYQFENIERLNSTNSSIFWIQTKNKNTFEGNIFCAEPNYKKLFAVATVHNTLKVSRPLQSRHRKILSQSSHLQTFSCQFPKPLSPFNRQLSSLDVRHTPIITRTNRVWLAEDTFFALGMNRISWSCTRCCHCSVKKCFVVTASDINRFMRYLAKGGQSIVFF